MASSDYTATVTKRELGLDPVPEDATSRPHHVKRKNGTTSSFRNVHPSCGAMYETWTFFKAIFLYVDMCQYVLCTAVPIPSVLRCC